MEAIPSFRCNDYSCLMTLESLYPDLKEVGGLIEAINISFRQNDSALRAEGLSEGVRFVSYARVEKGERFSQIYIAEEERLFLIDFWRNGVQYANAKTDSINEIAEVVDSWVGKNCDISVLEGRRSVVLNEGAMEFDNGNEVEYRWQCFINAGWEDMPELIELVQAASKIPKLRQLFPFTSMNRLCFSRYTGYPYSADLPYIAPRQDGTYAVLGTQEIHLGVGTAESVVNIVLKNLPPNCGPAVAGTARPINAK